MTAFIDRLTTAYCGRIVENLAQKRAEKYAHLVILTDHPEAKLALDIAVASLALCGAEPIVRQARNLATGTIRTINQGCRAVCSAVTGLFSSKA